MTDRQSQNVANVAAWSFKVGGSELPTLLMDRMISAEVETSLELPDQAVMRFHDPKAELVNDSRFDPGKELEISVVGVEPGQPAPPLFKGEIVSVEPAFQDDFTATLTVRAYDKRHRMNREPKTKTFTQQKRLGHHLGNGTRTRHFGECGRDVAGAEDGVSAGDD